MARSSQPGNTSASGRCAAAREATSQELWSSANTGSNWQTRRPARRSSPANIKRPDATPEPSTAACHISAASLNRTPCVKPSATPARSHHCRHAACGSSSSSMTFASPLRHQRRRQARMADQAQIFRRIRSVFRPPPQARTDAQVEGMPRSNSSSAAHECVELATRNPMSGWRSRNAGCRGNSHHDANDGSVLMRYGTVRASRGCSVPAAMQSNASDSSRR